MTQKKDISHITALLLGKIRGTISEQEQKEYDELVRSGEISDIDAKFEQPQFILDKLSQHSKFDDRDAFAQFRRQTFSKRVNTKRRNIIVSAAAAVILVASIISAVVSYRTEVVRKENTMALAQTILPGSKRAQITLANGQTIELSKGAVDIKVEGVGSIKSDGGEIVYNSEAVSTTPSAKNTISVPRGGECAVLVLEDGTKVWLNADSKLEYPTKFSGKQRRVKIEGEVFFDVKHNEAVPFVVESPHITLTVRGTTFNVRDYSDETFATASLVSGRLEVDNANRTSKVILAPGYQAVSKNGSMTLDVKKMDSGVVAGWTENKFSFWQQDLDEVLSDIARWYDITIIYDKNYVGNYSLTGKIPRDCSLAEVLELLGMITDAEFIFYDRTLTVKAK